MGTFRPVPGAGKGSPFSPSAPPWSRTRTAANEGSGSSEKRSVTLGGVASTCASSAGSASSSTAWAEAEAEVLERLGAEVERTEHAVSIGAEGQLDVETPYDLVRRMRASILVLGPLLA